MQALQIPRLSHAVARSARIRSHPLWRPAPCTYPSGTRRQASYLPTILQPAFWRSLVPTFLRRRPREPGAVRTRGPWNPATFYIWMFLLIGSQSVQMITLRGQVDKYTRDTEAKLEVLREVIRRVKDGEEVDVEGLLGTGDPLQEDLWEDVMNELEAEDELYNAARRQRKSSNNGHNPE